VIVVRGAAAVETLAQARCGSSGPPGCAGEGLEAEGKRGIKAERAG
jgi:hypothetical protein